ncbi:hypothetical protein [uncultured Roseobacter sp.]|uniref:hypothetical protein n=1 Tax=uncultured Roseobacter sp. TaxID=114847 RepID=UPI002623B892|nr:hypothetical protein [uncultured Roseobacter sp.]
MNEIEAINHRLDLIEAREMALQKMMGKLIAECASDRDDPTGFIMSLISHVHVSAESFDPHDPLAQDARRHLMQMADRIEGHARAT